MRRLVLLGPGRLRLEEVPEPVPGPDEVVVAVEAAGVCGSDVHGFRGLNGRRRPGTVMGHEVSGTVVDVGPGADPGWVGQAVAVNPVLGCGGCPSCAAGQPQQCAQKALLGCVPAHPGGFADLLVAPVSALERWPGPAPLAWGAFAEPLAVGLHALQGTDLQGSDVLVLGSGAIGIATGLAALRAGARVTVTDRDDRRSALLARLGLVPSSDQALPGGFRVDLAVDCVGSEESLECALRRVQVGGSVVLLGLGASRVPVPVERLVQADLTLRGSAQYSRASYRAAVAWLSSGELDVSALLGAPLPLASAPRLFDAWDDGERPVKSLLAPR